MKKWKFAVRFAVLCAIGWIAQPTTGSAVFGAGGNDMEARKVEGHATDARGNNGVSQNGDFNERVIYEDTTNTGWLFVEGKFISRPYRVQASSTRITVNGVEIRSSFDTLAREYYEDEGLEEAETDEEDAIEHENTERYQSRGESRFGGGRHKRQDRRRYLSTKQHAMNLQAALDSDGVVLAFGNQPLLYMLLAEDRETALRAIASGERRPQDLKAFLATRRLPSERQKLETWLAGFTPSDELRQLARAHIDTLNKVEAKNIRSMQANRLLNFLAYPLTVLGMVVCALALGHLLRSSHKPTEKQDPAQPEWIRAATISIGFILVMSSFDLIWTLLASEAGQMREINPVGSRLIQNPLALFAFKTAWTLLSCAILLRLRQTSQAQFASWWLCLVCTILTFRWVMFNSMFVA